MSDEDVGASKFMSCSVGCSHCRPAANVSTPAVIWAMADDRDLRSACVHVVAPEDVGVGRWLHFSLQGGEDTPLRTGRCTVSGLQPTTRYRYRVVFSQDAEPANHGACATGGTQTERSGEFTTFAARGEPATFAFNFGSCLYPSLVPMMSLESLRQDAAAFLLLIGDAVYADPPFNFFTSNDMLYKMLATDRAFSALTSTVPLFR